MQEIIEIKLENLVIDKSQPRKFFNDNSLDDLRHSLEANGQIQPILVNDNHDGTYTIIEGERRYRSAKASDHFSKLDAIIKNYTPAETKKVQLISNWDREDISLLDKAIFLESYINDYYAGDIKSASDALGKTKSTIYRIINVNKLHTDVKNLIADDYIKDYTYLSKLNNLRENNKEEFEEFVTRLKTGDIKNIRQELNTNPNTQSQKKKDSSTRTKLPTYRPRTIQDIEFSNSKVDELIIKITDKDCIYQFKCNDELSQKIISQIGDIFEAKND